jgi:predicted ArsR family transcriptional regulator
LSDLIAPTRVLRQLSVQAVMTILLREGAASRAGLSRKTGLSKQTMSEVIRLLTERGWVRESGMISGGVGRSAVRYEVDADAGYVLGLDLGASTIRASIANIAGAIVRESEVRADPQGGMRLIEQIVEHEPRALQESGHCPPRHKSAHHHAHGDEERREALCYELGRCFSGAQPNGCG